jgi:hypothetical protein
VLLLIARAAGHPARRASKQLLDAYGPLHGLHLTGTNSLASVLATVSRDPLRYARTSALTLTIPAAAPPSGARTYSAFIAAAPAAFPRLEALALPAAPFATNRDLFHLVPLGASLTSLTIPAQFVVNPAGSLYYMRPYGALRSLTISGTWQLPGGPERLQCMMEQLNDLPLLQHLHVFDPWAHHPLLPAAAHLPTLRCAATLTHLACGLFLEDWDAAALKTLGAGLPSLVSLALVLGRPPTPGTGAAPAPVGVAGILAALAKRTALTALELRMVDARERCGFSALAAMPRLARLRLRFDHPCGDLAPLLGPLSQLRALTQLRVAAPGGGLSRSALQHLAGLAGSLRHLDLDMPVGPAADVLGHVGMLTQLGTLRLPRLRPGQLATGDMASLSTLRVLEVLAVRDNEDGTAPLFVHHAASQLACLRELMVENCGGHGIADGDVARLLPLQPHLTRLVLAGLYNVNGPGFAALRHMKGLRLLEVRFDFIYGELLLGGPAPAAARPVQAGRVLHQRERERGGAHRRRRGGAHA